MESRTCQLSPWNRCWSWEKHSVCDVVNVCTWNICRSQEKHFVCDPVTVCQNNTASEQDWIRTHTKRRKEKTKTKSKPTHELYLLNDCKIFKWPDCVNAQIKAIIKWSLKDLLFVTPEKNNSKNSAKVCRYGWKARRMITDHCTDSHNFHAHQKQETDKIKRRVQQIWFGPLSRWYVWLRCEQNGYK